EDGIRDKLVTGVQTCALPILPSSAGGFPSAGAGTGTAMTLPTTADLAGSSKLLHAAETTIACAALPVARSWITSPWLSAPALGRSEERRVGKECRCRRAGEYG